jgi:hypothetical protein
VLRRRGGGAVVGWQARGQRRKKGEGRKKEGKKGRKERKKEKGKKGKKKIGEGKGKKGK